MTVEVFKEFVNLVVLSICEIIVAIFRFFSPEKPKSLKGEVAIVTGAGHGIGRQLALQLSQIGVKVVAWDINENSAEETAVTISKNGGTSWAFKCDVGNRDEVAKVAQKTRETVGTVTMLFNNVGIMPCKPFLRITPQEVEHVFKVNVFSQFWTLSEFLPDFLVQQRGHIVCMSSTAGLVGTKNLSAYCSTKFALNGLMDSLFLELRDTKSADNIFTTVVHPFVVNTGLSKKPLTRFPSLVPIVEPEEAARIVIEAVCVNKTTVLVPTHLYYISVLYSYPFYFLTSKMRLALNKFMGCGVGAHD